nr:MAG TPA: hypothetical protein [Caudoviricetes sp.]
MNVLYVLSIYVIFCLDNNLSFGISVVISFLILRGFSCIVDILLSIDLYDISGVFNEISLIVRGLLSIYGIDALYTRGSSNSVSSILLSGNTRGLITLYAISFTRGAEVLSNYAISGVCNSLSLSIIFIADVSLIVLPVLDKFGISLPSITTCSLISS